MTQNPVRLDPQSLWLSCCRTGKPRGKDGECFTSLFPVCPPCQSTSTLGAPQYLSSSKPLLQTHPYALLLLGRKEGWRETTLRGQSIPAGRGHGKLGMQKDKSSRAGQGAAGAARPCQPQCPASCFHPCPGCSESTAFLWTSGSQHSFVKCV